MTFARWPAVEQRANESIMLCYIGIGSNLGNRQQNIDKAVQELKASIGIEVKRISPIYETEPAGGPKQGKYLNGVIEIEANVTPEKLLDILLNIENKLGRQRTVRNGPRVIDLDILLYGDKKIDSPCLKIPHPRMKERDFVMMPLNELLRK